MIKLTVPQYRIVSWMENNGPFEVTFWGGKPFNSLPNGARLSTVKALVRCGVINAIRMGSAVKYSLATPKEELEE